MPPRPKKPSEKVATQSKLLQAIDFLSTIQKDEGAPYETHILLQNQCVVGYNDTLSAGAFVDEAVLAAPHTTTLLKALVKCGQDYQSLTIDGQKITLKAGKFKASIPCIDPTLIQFRSPDNPCAVIDDRLKEALKCIDVIKPEPNAQEIHLLSFLLNGQSLVGTDGRILIEYWHGIDLPTLTIPKAVIAPILKNNKKLTQFGFSNNSVTFFFEDNSWIKSQLYAKQYPIERMGDIINRPSNPSPVPADFYKALSAVAPFSPEGRVFFKQGLLCSHSVREIGATYDVPGLPEGPVFSAKYLALAKDYIEQIDFMVDGGKMAYFFGKQCRGVIAGHG